MLDPVPAGIIALGFNYGAYMTEIFRAGIQAVPRGQREAAQALGMTERLDDAPDRAATGGPHRHTGRSGNDFIAMIKDTALVSVMGIQELMWRANTVGRRKVHIIEALLIAAAVYWVLTIVFSYFQERLERRLARSDR